MCSGLIGRTNIPLIKVLCIYSGVKGLCETSLDKTFLKRLTNRHQSISMSVIKATHFGGRTAEKNL